MQVFTVELLRVGEGARQQSRRVECERLYPRPLCGCAQRTRPFILSFRLHAVDSEQYKLECDKHAVVGGLAGKVHGREIFVVEEVCRMFPAVRVSVRVRVQFTGSMLAYARVIQSTFNQHRGFKPATPLTKCTSTAYMCCLG